MSIKRSLFAGSVVAILAAGAFFKVGQETQRKSKSKQAAEQELRILSGANGAGYIHNNSSADLQSHQSSQPITPVVKLFWTQEEWLRQLSGKSPV